MADKSQIEWTEATWNPIAGCSVVSPGCTNCYAMRRVAPRLSANPATPHYAGTVQPSKAGPVWTGKIGIAADSVLLKPLRWRRPRMIFVNSTSDLFHESVPDEVIDRIFAVMALCPQHTFQVLTKRAERMRGYLSTARAHPVGLEALVLTMEALAKNPKSTVGKGIKLEGDDFSHLSVWPLPNVWLGVSVEDQTRADERIPALLVTRAAKRFISAEPLLGPIDLTRLHGEDGDWGTVRFYFDAMKGWVNPEPRPGMEDMPASQLPPGGPLGTRLDWVIDGGKSGKQARPSQPTVQPTTAATTPFTGFGAGACAPPSKGAWEYDHV